jgi:hypothetical protein
MATWVWILIVVAAVVVVALVAMAVVRRRTAALRERFGPEYDRALEAHEDRRVAEAELRARERQRAEFEIKPLPETARLRFAEEWRGVQERFVDEPPEAVAAANTLVNRVMEERGYPLRDFQAQAGTVSVDYPDVAEDYRAAHALWERSRGQQVGTEDMREALLRYRALFQVLLRPDGDGTAAGAGAPAREPVDGGQPVTEADRGPSGQPME